MASTLLTTIASTSNPDKSYKIHSCSHNGVAYMSCTCPAWIYSGKGMAIHARKPCKHIKALVAQIGGALGAEAAKSQG